METRTRSRQRPTGRRQLHPAPRPNRLRGEHLRRAPLRRRNPRRDHHLRRRGVRFVRPPDNRAQRVAPCSISTTTNELSTCSPRAALAASRSAFEFWMQEPKPPTTPTTGRTRSSRSKRALSRSKRATDKPSPSTPATSSGSRDSPCAHSTTEATSQRYL